MVAPPALAGAAHRVVDALAGAHTGLLVAAVVLHVGAQLCRGLAWHGVLAVAWPGVTRRRTCTWHVCGAGLSGVLSVRGGDAVRIVLARRELRGATVPALAGTLAAEGLFEAVCTAALAIVAIHFGVAGLGAPPATTVAVVAVGVPLLAAVLARSARVRRLGRELLRGLAVLGHPRRWAGRVLPFQVCGRLLRLCAAACFLAAFGLPVAPAVVLAACAAQGSGAALPIPGAGPAAVTGAMLVALPAAAGGPIDPAAVAALAVVQPAVLTVVGVALSLTLLAAVSGARTPRGLVRAARALRARPAPAPAAP